MNQMTPFPILLHLLPLSSIPPQLPPHAVLVAPLQAIQSSKVHISLVSQPKLGVCLPRTWMMAHTWRWSGMWRWHHWQWPMWTIAWQHPHLPPLQWRLRQLQMQLLPTQLLPSIPVKKTKQAELSDMLGGEVLATTGLGVEERMELTMLMQAVSKPTIQKASGRGSVPEAEAEKYGNFCALN